MSIEFIIKCDNLEEYIIAQNRLFDNGYAWFSGSNK